LKGAFAHLGRLHRFQVPFTDLRHVSIDVGTALPQFGDARERIQLDATPMQVAIAWLLQRAPNMLLISGTSSVQHVRENVKAASLVLDEAALAALEEMHLAA